MTRFANVEVVHVVNGKQDLKVQAVSLKDYEWFEFHTDWSDHVKPGDVLTINYTVSKSGKKHLESIRKEGVVKGSKFWLSNGLLTDCYGYEWDQGRHVNE